MKTKLQLYPNPTYFGHDVEITTEHAASSYGIPVLVIDGLVYGRGDMLPNGQTGEEYAGRFDTLDPISDTLDVSAETEQRHAAIDAFCGKTTPLPKFA